MKVKELIEELKKFDENTEVQYDYDCGYQTVYIEKVSLEHEDYTKDKKEVVVLY
jgi:hypothetical protein